MLRWTEFGHLKERRIARSLARSLPTVLSHSAVEPGFGPFSLRLDRGNIVYIHP